MPEGVHWTEDFFHLASCIDNRDQGSIYADIIDVTPALCETTEDIYSRGQLLSSVHGPSDAGPPGRHSPPQTPALLAFVFSPALLATPAPG
jgi:hypothetical protein